MLLSSTEMYNNEQVSEVFRQNFSLNMSNMDYFIGSKSQKSPSDGLPFRFND